MGASHSSDPQAFFKGRYGSPLALTDEIFKAFDKNANGQLEVNELGSFINAAFPQSNCSPQEVQKLMDLLDLDHNGSVGVNELRAFLRCYDPSSQTVASKSALVIIDVQNDFITGSLANPFNAHEIVPIINSIRDQFDMVVISYDYHPQEHCSFVDSVSNGRIPIKEPVKQFDAFSSVTLVGDRDRPEHSQVLYPRHCVVGTEGCACHRDLIVRESDGKIYKGVRPNIDSYSAFFDNCKANDTGLTKMLTDNGITDVYCCGLVFDICVKSSALHGAEMGFKTSVIEDCCRPFMADKVPEVKEQLAAAGVEVLDCATAVRQVATEKSRSLKEFLQFSRASSAAVDIHQQLERTTSSHAPSPLNNQPSATPVAQFRPFATTAQGFQQQTLQGFQQHRQHAAPPVVHYAPHAMAPPVVAGAPVFASPTGHYPAPDHVKARYQAVVHQGNSYQVHPSQVPHILGQVATPAPVMQYANPQPHGYR